MLTNDATGKILGAYNGVWANGSGATDITNAGLIEASKAGAMFGTPGSAIEADGGGIIANSGIIRSTSTDGSDVGIYFTGAGSITNSGTIESLDGGLAISFNGSGTHTLTLATGSVLVGDVKGGPGIDNLVLKGKGSETIDKFLNFETLSLQGTDWTLTGDGSFLTSADVESGRLHVNGVLTVPTLSVLPGGTLDGSGEIIGAVDARGVIAPGNSIGTLTVSSVSFDPHSIFAVEIDPTKADKLVVTGAATIDPAAKVAVLPAPGAYTDGQEYLILDAGTRTGTFGGIIENSAFLDFALDDNKDPDQVWLDITRVATFPDVADTPNQMAAAMGLEALGPGNPIFDAIELLDAADARRAFDLSSGEVHASIKGALLDDSRFVREAAIDRLRQRFDADFSPADPSLATLSYDDEAGGAHVDWPLAARRGETVWSSWGQGFGSWGDFGGDGNAAALGRSVGGFVVGADATIAETWRFGIAGAINPPAWTFPIAPRRPRSRDITWPPMAASSAGRSRFASAAPIRGPTSTPTEASSSPASAIPSRELPRPDGAGFRGTRLRHARGRIRGRALRRACLCQPRHGGFTEQGGAGGADRHGSNQDITFANLGARFGATVPSFGDGRATVHGVVAWQHALDDVTPASTFAFNGGAGVPFTIDGIPIATDALSLEAGFDWALSDRARLALAYSGQIAARVQDHGLKAKLSVSF